MEHSIEITSAVDPTPLLSHTEIEIHEEIEYGRRANHIIKIKEIDSQVESANQMINERFKEFENMSIESTTIFKVHAGLRESNPDAYTPKVVSIGPYHRNNPKLHSMEKYKLLYLKRFLHRNEGIDLEYCLRELKELKDKTLKCYEDIDDTDGNFLQMMLLDGCFVVEHIREGFCSQGEKSAIEGGINNQVYSDILLIENQLPFFILIKLDDMTKQDNPKPFILMVKLKLLLHLPKITPASLLGIEGNSDSTEVKHLLQLVHMTCYPLKTSMGKKDSLKDMQNDEGELTWSDKMPKSTELSEAGVSFKKVGKIYNICQLIDNIEDTTSLFDINFENGMMEIPCFNVVDSTESILRNLIAYEQQSSDVYPRYFSDYSVFMDHLIDSHKDVSLFRKKGIIMNKIGEDKEVACLFNKIGKGVAVGRGDRFYYNEE